MLIWVAVVAGGPNLLLAKQTLATGDGERNNNPIAATKVRDLFAYLFNDPHQLVTEDVARSYGRDEAIVEMEIGTADRCAVILIIA